jgi:hypothetical protein
VTAVRASAIGGGVAALVGASLVFALDDPEASLVGVSLQPFGGVLLAAGVLLLAFAALGSVRGSGGARTGSNGGEYESIRAIGGLLVVVAGIVAVTALTIITLTRLGSTDEDSMVAVTSSAFGIISAVIGAYLGIKISAESNEKWSPG